MPPGERGKYINERLAWIVNHAYTHAPAVRDRFDGAGISHREIRTFRDMENIPVMRN